MARIHFLDVTNRDGVQTARTGLSKFGKTMVNFYLGRLGVAQSEIGFPFLFHEVPYVRAQIALAEAGAFGALRLSGWCRGVAEDVEKAVGVRVAGTGLRHYNLSISTSDYMIANKFRGRLDRDAIVREMVSAVRAAKEGGAETVGVNAEDGSRTDDGFLTEFALAAKEAGADRLRYCDTIGGDTPDRIRERFAKLASSVGMPIETHCHNDLGMAVANSVSGALGDLEAGQDAWINTCINGIGNGRATPTSFRRFSRSGTVSGSKSEAPRSAIRSTCRGPVASRCGRATRSGSRSPTTRSVSGGTRSRTSRASTPTGR